MFFHLIYIIRYIYYIYEKKTINLQKFGKRVFARAKAFKKYNENEQLCVSDSTAHTLL